MTSSFLAQRIKQTTTEREEKATVYLERPGLSKAAPPLTLTLTTSKNPFLLKFLIRCCCWCVTRFQGFISMFSSSVFCPTTMTMQEGIVHHCFPSSFVLLLLSPLKDTQMKISSPLHYIQEYIQYSTLIM